MSSHPYPYVKQTHPCLHCGKQLTGRQGNFCSDNDDCIEAKKKRKRATEKAWNAIHKPWRQRNYEHSAKEKKPKEEPAKKLRYCKYQYCKRKKVALPNGYYLYHPECHQRIIEIYGRGITTELGI